MADSAQIDSVIQQMQQLTALINSQNVSPSQKSQLQVAAQGLLAATKTINDNVTDTLTSMATLAALRMFVKWKVFDSIPLGGGAISYAELANSLGADPNLISKLPPIHFTHLSLHSRNSEEGLNSHGAEGGKRHDN